MIDAISLTLGGSLIVWITVVQPAVEGEATLSARIASVAGWVGYVAVLAASVRVVLAWRRNTSVTLLGLGVLGFLIAEIFYGNALVAGSWVVGGPVDVGYFAFTVLCGAAALEPSMRDVASPPNVRHTLGPARLALIATTCSSSKALLVVELGQVNTGVAIAVVSALVSVLMLIRLSMTGRAYQRRAAGEHAARTASQALVSATSADDVVAAARAALRRVVTGPGPAEVELVRSSGPGVAGVVAGPGGVGRLAVPLAGSDSALLFIAPGTELNELSSCSPRSPTRRRSPWRASTSSRRPAGRSGSYLRSSC